MSTLVTVTSTSPTSPAYRIKDVSGVLKYLEPEPLISFSSSPVQQGSHSLGYEHNVTLTCYAHTTGNATERANTLLNNIASLDNFFTTEAKEFQIMGAANATHPAYTWNILNPTVSTEESNFYNLVKYTINFTGYTPESGGSVSGTISHKDDDQVINTNFTSIPLASFSDTFDYQPDDSLGYAFDDPTAKPYRFTRTVSATARPVSNASLHRDSVFQASAVSGAKTFVEARLAYDGTDIGAHQVSDTFRYGEGISLFNLQRSVNIDMANLSYSVTINGIYASGSAGSVTEQGAFETYSTTVSKEANTPIVSVTVDGKLMGYQANTQNTNLNTVNAGATAGAMAKLSHISNGNYGYGSIIFRRAQFAAGVPLNSSPKSVSIADSTIADNSISYNVSYDNRPSPIISGAITESVTVNDSYPTDVYASIQVMGKRSGPVFQYMNTTTHYERDVSIELQMDLNNIPNTLNGAALMGYSPSLDSNTRDAVNGLINSLSPAGSWGYVMLKSCNESWSPKDGRYTANIGWIYK